MLEHITDVIPAEGGEFRFFHGIEVLSAKEDLPLRGPHQSRHDLEKRALSRPGRADDRRHLARADVQGHVPDRRDRALSADEFLADMFQFQYRHVNPPV